MTRFVASAPYYDIVTYLWCPYYRTWWKRELESYRINYTPLFADEAQKNRVAEEMAKPDAKALIGAGHGARCIFTGQYSRTIYQCGESFEELKGKCFAPVSCHVGEQLVPDMVRKGVACGIGEIDPYYFVVSDLNPKKGEDPRSEDPLMACFIEAEAFFSRWLAAGRTAGEAYEAMQAVYSLMAMHAIYVLRDYETAYYLLLDARNRAFFGDRGWAARPAEEVTATHVTVKAEVARDVEAGVDRLTLHVAVAGADGANPGGRADVLIITQEQDTGKLETVHFEGEGFTATYEFKLRILADTVYKVAVIYYGGERGGTVYAPQIAVTVVVTKQEAKATKVELRKVECKRVDLTTAVSRVDFTIEGTVTTDDGKPVARGNVELTLEGGVRATGKTDENGFFTFNAYFYPEPLETRRSGTVLFKGDWVKYKTSSASFTLKYPVNFKFVLLIGGAVTVLFLLILLLLTFI